MDDIYRVSAHSEAQDGPIAYRPPTAVACLTSEPVFRDLLDFGPGELTAIERWQIRFVRRTFESASVDEVIRLLQEGGAFVGLHPEGKRNKSDDPYTLLPARPGVGRIIQATRGRATVIPVFVNGLGNDIVRQIAGNYLKKGDAVTIVFGEPIDFGDLTAGASTAERHQRISEYALDAVRALGEEERVLRAKLTQVSRAATAVRSDEIEAERR